MIDFRLKEMRERAGVSVEELDRQIRTVGFVRFLEDHRSDEDRAGSVTWITAVKIARALGCSLDELAGIEAAEQNSRQAAKDRSHG